MSKKSQELTKATYNEWLASIFGACFIAFGLGVLLVNYFSGFVYLIILVGIVVHSWGMYKIHQRNK